MGCIMAIDYGEKRIGVAVTDRERILARGLTTIHLSKKAPDAIGPVLALLKTHQPDVLVVGLPRNMDGSEGFMVDAVYDFCEALAALDETPIELLDERLTSRMAEQSLRAAGKKPSRDKGSIDQEAARLILEDYLTTIKNRR